MSRLISFAVEPWLSDIRLSGAAHWAKHFALSDNDRITQSDRVAMQPANLENLEMSWNFDEPGKVIENLEPFNSICLSSEKNCGY